jgi:hypothetical protein
MTGNGGNYWIIPGVTNDFFENIIGVYGDPLIKGTYYFWA